MGRAPFQVHVIPYYRRNDGNIVYALFRRADLGFWQGVAGGGEDDETPLEAARRETYEEAGIPPTAAFMQLDTIEPIPVTAFSYSHIWGEKVYEIPQYGFGVKAESETLRLSPEHTEYLWLPYTAAVVLLKYDGNKKALWELNQRLLGRGPRG